MSRTSTAAAAFLVPVEASGRDTSMVSIGRIGIPAFRGRQFRRGAEQQGRDTPRWSFGEEPVPWKGGQPRGSGKQKRNAPSVYARSAGFRLNCRDGTLPSPVPMLRHARVTFQKQRDGNGWRASSTRVTQFAR